MGLLQPFVGREWLRNETFPPGKAGRSATVPALQFRADAAMAVCAVFCRAGMVEERDLPAARGWKVCDRSSPTIPRQMWPWRFVRPLCRAGMVEVRDLPAARGWKVCDRSSPTIPRRMRPWGCCSLL